MTMTTDYRVPPGESPYECAYCGHPFREEEYLVLHRGLEHGNELPEDEVEAFYDTYEAETEELKHFRLKALGILVLLYFGFLFIYAIIGIS
jgi:CRISPR/Cas system endoribonuclease Cas6 (RAMP superfamily)